MRAWLFLVPFAIAASCGGRLDSGYGGSDAGSDVLSGGACNTSADCPSGGDCAYPVNAGCSAQKQCFPPKKACKSMSYCACDGTTTADDCNGGAPKPVAHSGPCDEPPPNCALACEICDVTGFSVSPMAKPTTGSNQCTPGDITSFVNACLSVSATQATCSAWQKSDAGVSSCGACVLTQETGASWGPIVCQATSCSINSGGCVDLVSGEVGLENGTNGSCGDLLNARDECVGYACGGCTGSSDSTTCGNDALQAECKSYTDAAANASMCAPVDAGSSVCSPQSDAEWASFINVFCGSGP